MTQSSRTRRLESPFVRYTHARAVQEECPRMSLIFTLRCVIACGDRLSGWQVAAKVALTPHEEGGYGNWPLTGSCAAGMRTQGLIGASITLDEPYHGGWAWMGSLLRALMQQFVLDPTRAFAAGSLFSYNGVPLTQMLCATQFEDKVLSGAVCDGPSHFMAVEVPPGLSCGEPRTYVHSYRPSAQ